MKLAVLVGDGMADLPLTELGNKTLLDECHIPNMDWIARNGSGGAAVTVPDGMHPGSDVANLGILGFDPKRFYTGRGPLEGASYGISLGDADAAFRCNFVTIENGVMADYSAGHIKTEDASRLIGLLNEKISVPGIKFYPGVSYRNLTVINEGLLNKGEGELECTPPHDIIGKKISGYMPRGRGADTLNEIMGKAEGTLSGGIRIWLWGGGEKPELPLFKDRFGVTGAMISAVGLLKGIGRYLGMDVIDVPGATGYYDTDYEAKAEYAVSALKKYGLVFVHVEAPDEAGHNGDIKNKKLAIERFDKKTLGIVAEYMRGLDEYRILVMPDHATPVYARTHTSVPVPFAVCGTDIHTDNMTCFSEREAGKGMFGKMPAHKLMEMLCRV